MHFFDSHAHFTDPDLLKDVEGVLQRAKEAQVLSIVNICTEPQNVRDAKKIVSHEVKILHAGATPPHTAKEEGNEAFSFFQQQAQEGFFCAIGETGLEYYHPIEKEPQIELLIRYLHLAKQHNLPLIFHCREAFADLFHIVDREYPNARAILHCFTGTKEEAKGVLSRGWLLSFSGIVTFKKSEWLREIAKETPLSQLVIETDAPYLAPQSRRGKRNEPAFLVETASCLAQLKGVPLEEFAQKTKENGERLLTN